MILISIQGYSQHEDEISTLRGTLHSAGYDSDAGMGGVVLGPLTPEQVGEFFAMAKQNPALFWIEYTVQILD